MISKTLAHIATNQALISWMACGGLVIFITFFAALLIWTARKENRLLYQAMSLMPIKEENSK